MSKRNTRNIDAKTSPYFSKIDSKESSPKELLKLKRKVEVKEPIETKKRKSQNQQSNIGKTRTSTRSKPQKKYYSDSESDEVS